MKKTLLSLAIAGILAQPAFCSIAFNNTITYINGTGNPDTGWTSDTENGNLQVALRADNRTTGATPNNGAGVYTFAPGIDPGSGNAIWNFQFTVNSGANPLSTYYFWIAMSGSSPANGTITPSVVNLLNNGIWFDNAYGNNSTPNGGGTVASSPANAVALAAANNVAANSESISFLRLQNDLGGIYNFELYATRTDDPNAAKLADVSIQVQVVPEASTFAAGALLLMPLGLGAFRVLRRTQPA